jgi:hypothetical protein
LKSVVASRVEKARALPLFRLSHFFKTTIKKEVWVKVGKSKVTGVLVDNAVPRIDHLKAAVKMTLVNKFLTTDKDDIVIRDPISKEEISSIKLLNLIDATAKKRRMFVLLLLLLWTRPGNWERELGMSCLTCSYSYRDTTKVTIKVVGNDFSWMS